MNKNRKKSLTSVSRERRIYFNMYNPKGFHMDHHITLQRLAHGVDSTVGVLLNEDNNFMAFIIEDEPRKVKVKGETRLPAGTFEIKFREVLSPMTKRYRSRFEWFKWHLELQDVPNFEYCYIHIGNTDDHTDGCLLTNYGVNAVPSPLEDGSEEFEGFSSKNCFTDVYIYIHDLLELGHRVFITIKDETNIVNPF